MAAENRPRSIIGALAGYTDRTDLSSFLTKEDVKDDVPDQSPIEGEGPHQGETEDDHRSPDEEGTDVAD